jgi:protein-disulfide isomerase
VGSVAGLGAAAQQSSDAVNERGPATADVTIIEFCTYESEACSRLGVIMDVMLHEFHDRVRLVFHGVPADGTSGASYRYRAALAAGNQGRFWDMHQLLLSNRDRATETDVVAMANQLGLDLARFGADLASLEIATAVLRDKNEAASQGITSTPAVFINGRPLATFKEAKDLRAAILQALPR